MVHKHIAVIGAGYSGVIFAMHMVKTAPYPVHVTLIERREAFGEGIAYSTHHPQHLLNVRAAKMSAYPDEPSHFIDWIRAEEHTWRQLDPAFEHTQFDENSFVPRMIFGAYIKDQLAHAHTIASANGHKLELQHHAVQDITLERNKCRILFADGDMLADAAILTTGNLPTREARYEKKLFHAPYRFARDMWNPPRQHILGPDTIAPTKPIAIIGSGLTMVDAVISLREKNVNVPIITFSRHGHLPSVHEHYAPYPANWEMEKQPKTTLALMRHIRKTTKKAVQAGYHWQAVFDSLRSLSNPIWQTLPNAEKRKFFRHLFSLWNVHRHRMPPESAALLGEMHQSGQLQHIKASIIDADVTQDGLLIAYHEKYVPGIQTMEVSYVINCTGSESDIGNLPSSNLLHRLVDRDYMTVSPLRSGIKQEHGRLTGEAMDHLFAVGPIFLGGLIETTAVPDLRIHVQTLVADVIKCIKERDTNHFTI